MDSTFPNLAGQLSFVPVATPAVESPDPHRATTWGLTNGRWEPLADDPLEPFEVAGGPLGIDCEKTVQAAGYSPPDFTAEESPSVQVRHAWDTTSVTNRWPFLVEFCIGDSQCFSVFVGSLPDLLSLAPAIGAFAARDAAAEQLARRFAERRKAVRS